MCVQCCKSTKAKKFNFISQAQTRMFFASSPPPSGRLAHAYKSVSLSENYTTMSFSLFDFPSSREAAICWQQRIPRIKVRQKLDCCC